MWPFEQIFIIYLANTCNTMSPGLFANQKNPKVQNIFQLATDIPQQMIKQVHTMYIVYNNRNHACITNLLVMTYSVADPGFDERAGVMGPPGGSQRAQVAGKLLSTWSNFISYSSFIYVLDTVHYKIYENNNKN